VRGEEFQLWKLTARAGFSATVVCDDANNNIIYTMEIEYTDFPLNEIKFDFANNVILLLSEY